MRSERSRVSLRRPSPPRHASSSATLRQETWHSPHRCPLAGQARRRRAVRRPRWRSARYGLYWLIDRRAAAPKARTAGGPGSRWSFRSRCRLRRDRAWSGCFGRTSASTRAPRRGRAEGDRIGNCPAADRRPARPCAADRAADRRRDRQPRRAARAIACRSTPLPAGCRSRWRPSAWSGTRSSRCSSCK